MIDPQGLEATIYGIRTALEDTDTLEAFRRGELAFLLDHGRVTLVQRGPDILSGPEIVTEVSNN